jgi:hypothetical protein
VLLTLAATNLLARNLSPTGQYAPDRIIVKFKVPVSVGRQSGPVRTGIGEIDALNQVWQVAGVRKLCPGATDLLARRMGIDRLYVLETAGPIDVERAVADYSAASTVEYAEPDFAGHACATVPDDPSYGNQWGLKNTGQDPGGYGAGTAGCDIDAELAWDVERGSRDVVIGHLDAGVDLDHPDFVTNYQTSVWWRNIDEIPGNNIDDDSNGFKDDTVGWNFAYSNNNPQDDNGHGTHTAGTIGAHTNNSTGVAGVCWYCQIMPVKVLDSTGFGWYSWWISGIDYAVKNGARLINMSLGGTSYSSALEDEINYAWNSGVLPIVAMGNDTLHDDSTRFYPAAFANVIAVGATANSDERMVRGHKGSIGWSMWGSWIDVVAPGNAVYSTWTDGYAYDWGTSMATPHVTGTAALMLSRNPDLTNSETKDILQSTAEDLGTPGFDVYFGYGRINANQALQPVLRLPGWTAETLLATSPNGCNEQDIAVSGQNVHVVHLDRGGSSIGLYYFQSSNGGRTWDAARLLSNMTYNWGYFHPQIVAGGNSVRVVFHDKRGTYNTIYLKQSTDNGATWGTDIAVSDTSVESSNPDICTAGDTIHVIWDKGYRRSVNGGSSWEAINAAVTGQAIACANGKVYVVGQTVVGGAHKLTFQRYNGTSWESAIQFGSNGTSWPNLDVAAGGNNIYITWDQELDNDGTPEEIRLRRSTDCGANWGNDQRLANIADNYACRNPRLAAANGMVHLTWWGDRDKCWSYDVYYRQSADSGATWGNTYRLTYYGDNDFDEKPAVAVFADTVHIVWDRLESATKSVYYIRKGIGHQGSVNERRGFSIGDSRLTITPNPVTGGFATVRFSGSSSIVHRSSLSLYDASGRLELTQPVSTSSFVLRTSDLCAGVYLLRVESGTRHEDIKFVVQH